MQELTRRMSSARAWGVEAHLLSPAEIHELVPHCESSLLIGGFYTPTGAIVDPLRAGELFRARAEAAGAVTTVAETEVTGIEVTSGRVRRVLTDRSEEHTSELQSR